jgi:hypothetical protein
MNLKVKRDMVVGLSRVSPLDGICEGCVLGNHQMDAFEIGKAWREKNQLELFHNDLCTLNKPSLASERYVLTFIDNFFRSTWVYFLKSKDRVFESLSNLRHWMKSNANDL